MSVKCVWASNGETGHIRNNKAGDQTGKEVKTGNWYYFGQNVVLRWKDRDKAKKYAKIMKQIADSSLVGYDQNGRKTLFNELKAVGWDVSRLKKKVETDCSAMTSVGVNAVGVKVSRDIYTGNMVNALMNTGEFTKLTGSKYLNSSNYNRIGDIIINENKHVITCLEDGPKAYNTTYTYEVGKTYTLQTNMNVREGVSLSSSRKLRKDLTADGKKHAKNTTYAVLLKGTKVTVREVKKLSSGIIRVRIPSGWISAKGVNKVYLK